VMCMKKTTDITALGELLIDFTQAGVSESGQLLFERNPGGAPANALAAASRQRRGVRNAGMDYIERQYVADAKAGRVKWVTLDSGKQEAV